MPRNKPIDPPQRIHIIIPTSMKVSVDFLLFSEVEGKVPHGAWQKFVQGLIREKLGGMSIEQLREEFQKAAVPAEEKAA